MTYTLSGADAGSFDIDDSTGQLKVASGTELDHETKDSYAVTVTATDPMTATDPSPDSDSIAVTIKVDDVDESPTLTGQDSVSHAENSILPVTEYDATDPEKESLTWLPLAGTDHDDFSISNGILSFRTAPNYELPTDAGGNNVYEVTVVASDGTSIPATLPVTVTVTNVDEVHTLTELFRVSSYAENGTGSVAEYSVTDLEENESVTWTLAGADRGDFSIVGGILRFVNSPDFEQPADANRNNVYEVTVRATAGIHTIPQTLTVRVTDVDEPPVLTGSPVPSEVPYDENNTAQVARYTATDPEGRTVIWTVTGTDADDFTISNGVLNFSPAPNYEARADADGDNNYEVTVVASDGDLTTPQALTVTINNLDEAGSLTLSSEYPQVDAELTATLTDPDGASDINWVWERSSNRSTWTEIAGADSDRYTPVTDDMNNYLRARVVYTDGHGDPGSKSFQREATNRVRAARGNNNVPLFSDATTTRRVQENTAAGRNIGTPVAATDADTDDPLTYSLDAAGDSVFAIDSRSGQLRTKAELDREKTSSYAVTVTATDPSGASDSIDVTITVTPVDEPLTLTGPSTTSYAENATGPVAILRAADPEHEHDPITWPITWALTGVDRNSLTLTANITDATLTFNDPPNYEADTRYTVTVEATAGSHTARETVTVNVTNVNEKPTLTGPIAINDYAEHGTGPVATYRATDPERDPIQWTVDSAAFTISDGVLHFRTPPDYEAASSYLVTVTASDGEFTDELPVTVSVTNEDEAGNLTLSSVQPQVDTALTATLTDPDGLVSIDWVWEQSQDKRTWEEIKGTIEGSYTPETDDVGAYLRVTVVYTDGDGTGADKRVPPIVAPYAVRQARANNDPPEFTGSPPTLTIGANARAGESRRCTSDGRGP